MKRLATMKFLIVRHFMLAFLCGSSINCEWLEIPQVAYTSTSKANIKFLSTSSALEVFETTSPSPYWVEYQKERFGNQKQQQYSQKLVVSSGTRLKNSAKVVVSPTKQPSTEIPARHQIINTKMALNVMDVNIERPMTEPPNTEHAHVEITSRKYTPGPSDENIEEGDEGVETNQEQDVPTGEGSEESDLEIYPTIQGFMGFLKSLKKNWFKKAALSINQKIKLLEILRDNLMFAIEERFMAIWEPKQVNRRKRGLTDEANFNFPPEAALMTINFLTFAVFLIKLVLNVVNIVKSKHYKFTGFGESETVRRPFF